MPPSGSPATEPPRRPQALGGVATRELEDVCSHSRGPHGHRAESCCRPPIRRPAARAWAVIDGPASFRTYLEAATNEKPILLLDDVLSELDESRRQTVLAAIEADQTIITSPDPDRFDQSFAATVQLWRITNGRAPRE